MAKKEEQWHYVLDSASTEEHTITSKDEEIKSSAKAEKEKNIEQNKLRGSTFTVTNLGGYGIHFFTPIINPPEVGILGLGKIDAYAAIENGEVTEKLRLLLSLMFDNQVFVGVP